MVTRFSGVLLLIASACAEGPPGAIRIDRDTFEAMDEVGMFFPYEEPDGERDLREQAERLAADRETVLDFLLSRPDLQGRLLAPATGEPAGDGSVTAVVGGATVVLQGEGARFATVAAAIRRFGTVENQLRLYEAQLALLPSDCLAQYPTLPEAEALDAVALDALNRDANACWHAWRDQVGAPPVPVAPPPQAPDSATGWEGAVDGSDDSGVCGEPFLVEYRDFSHTWALSPVKSQANRGTCASFGVAGALEYAIARRFDRFVNLSEQAIYAYGKFDMDGDDYGDGLSTSGLLEFLDDTDYAVPFEETWPYNPSMSRLICDGSDCSLDDQDDGDHYERSCQGYSDACSDTAHQMGIFSSGGQSWWYRPEAVDFTVYEAVDTVELTSFSEDDVDYAITLSEGGWGLVISMDIPEDFGDDGGTNPGGDVAGGHAMQVAAIHKVPWAPGGAFILLKNSWGCNFGDAGYTTIDAEYAEYYMRSLLAVKPSKGAGNARPTPTIESPANGVQYEVGGFVNAVTFRGSATDLEDVDCCELEWSSSLDGYMGSGPEVAHAFENEGTHVVTLTARDRDGSIGQASITVSLVNEGPDVEITTPADGYTTIELDTVAFVASAYDFSEPLGFPCDAYAWTSSNLDDPFPLVGCGVNARFETPGTRTITVTATDSFGATGSASIDVVIVTPDPYSDPTVTIVAPIDGSMIDPYDATALHLDFTTQVGGFLATGWTLSYKGVDYDLDPTGIFDTVVFADVVPDDCGAQPASIYAWITDANGDDIDGIDVDLGWPPC